VSGFKPRLGDRESVRKPTSGLVREDLPERVRNAVATRLCNTLDPEQRHAIALALPGEFDLSPDLVGSPGSFGVPLLSRDYHLHGARQLESFILNWPYPDILELFEVIYGEFRPKTAEEFRSFLNNRLARHHSAYVMNDGGDIYEPGTVQAEAAKEDARALVTHHDFNGPDRQFAAALEAFRRRPPNHEEAVGGAANALEGAVRVVLSGVDVKIGPGLSRIQAEKGLDGAHVAAMGAFWGFASDDARHGLVGDPTINNSIAEWAIHHAASSIAFIARLYGYEVAEGPPAR